MSILTREHDGARWRSIAIDRPRGSILATMRSLDGRRNSARNDQKRAGAQQLRGWMRVWCRNGAGGWLRGPEEGWEAQKGVETRRPMWRASVFI